MKSSWHVATAAEAIAAAQFARLGFNISVQYGANQPEYNLMVERDERALKVSVKGSQDKGWGLSQSQLAKLGHADYHGAADAWQARHKRGTVLCLVQFANVEIDELPRIYLASPGEVANRLRTARRGLGDTILWEDHRHGPRSAAAGAVERLPDNWRLTRERADEVLLNFGLAPQ